MFAPVIAAPRTNQVLRSTDSPTFAGLTLTGSISATSFVANGATLPAPGGFYLPAAGIPGVVANNSRGLLIVNAGGSANLELGSAGVNLLSGATLTWSASATDTGGTGDTILSRDAANTLAQKNGNADQLTRRYAMNGGYWERGSASELVTIAAAATTDTTGNLLPANAIIEAIVLRVTTVIPTAATFTVGDATIAARFATGIAVAANTTAVGLTHVDQTGTSGPKQVAAAKVRITPNLTPGAATGVVRITVFYRSFTPATS